MFRSLAIFIIIFLDTLVLGTAALLTVWFSSSAVFKMSQLWSRIVMWGAFGVKITVSGLEHIETKKSYVFLSNHQSAFDIPILIKSIPVQTRFIAKKELGRIPLWGWTVVAMGHVMIDRANVRNAKESIDLALMKLKKDHLSIIAFPEGTRTPDGSVLPFKKGVFQLAMDAEIPIVPITIRGAFESCPKGAMTYHPGLIEVIVHKAIETKDFIPDRRERLMQEVRAVITGDMGKA